METGLGKDEYRKAGWVGGESEDRGAKREENVAVLSTNTRHCMRRKERKTEQWEDKSPYIHRSPSIP
jgi:hypothetical protein